MRLLWLFIWMVPQALVGSQKNYVRLSDQETQPTQRSFTVKREKVTQDDGRILIRTSLKNNVTESCVQDCAYFTHEGKPLEDEHARYISCRSKKWGEKGKMLQLFEVFLQKFFLQTTRTPNANVLEEKNVHFFVLAPAEKTCVIQ